MNRAQQIQGVREAAIGVFLFSDDPRHQKKFDVAIARLIASARLDGAYSPEHTLRQHKLTRKGSAQCLNS